jgi:hypothetical protein
MTKGNSHPAADRAEKSCRYESLRDRWRDDRTAGGSLWDSPENKDDVITPEEGVRLVQAYVSIRNPALRWAVVKFIGELAKARCL